MPQEPRDSEDLPPTPDDASVSKTPLYDQMKAETGVDPDAYTEAERQLEEWKLERDVDGPSFTGPDN